MLTKSWGQIATAPMETRKNLYSTRLESSLVIREPTILEPGINRCINGTTVISGVILE
jgi:hypothetical protein